jgi:hypothetical protein
MKAPPPLTVPLAWVGAYVAAHGGYDTVKVGVNYHFH